MEATTGRQWRLFAGFALILVGLPMLRMYVLWPQSITSLETAILYVYLMIPGIVFGGGSWNAQRLHLAATGFYLTVAFAMARIVHVELQRRAR